MSRRSTSRLLFSIAVGLAALFSVAAGGMRRPQQAADAFTFTPITLPDHFFPYFVSPLPTGWGDLTSGQQAFADVSNGQFGSFTVQGTTAVIQRAFTLPSSPGNILTPLDAVLGPDRNLWGSYAVQPAANLPPTSYGIYRADSAGHVATVDLGPFFYGIVPSVDGSQAGPFVYMLQRGLFDDTRLVKVTITDPITPTVITLPTGVESYDCIVFGGAVRCAGIVVSGDHAPGSFVTVDAAGVPVLTTMPPRLFALTGTSDGNLLFVGSNFDPAYPMEPPELIETTMSGTVVHKYPVPDPLPRGTGLTHMERLASGKYCVATFGRGDVDLLMFDKVTAGFSLVSIPQSLNAYGFAGSGQSDYQLWVPGETNPGREPALFGVPAPSGPISPLVDSPIRGIGPSDLAPRSP